MESATAMDGHWDWWKFDEIWCLNFWLLWKLKINSFHSFQSQQNLHYTTSVQAMAFESNLRYNCRAALILGLLQVLMGVLVFMLQIPYITHDLAAVFAYVGFWAGLVVSCNCRPGGVSIYICHVTSIGIPMLKIRRSRDRLIFNMGIHIPGKDGLYIEKGPRFHCTTKYESFVAWQRRFGWGTH